MKNRIIRYSIAMGIIIMLCTLLLSLLIFHASDNCYTIIFIVILFAAILLLIGLISISIANSITRPITDINPSNPDVTHIYPELTPLVSKLSTQNEQLTSQMVQLQEESDITDTLRREFTANVSHELKTPLTSISGYSEIIRDGIVKKSDIPVFAGKIYDEASRLIALVDDIIKLSELDEKDIHADKKDVDLYKVAKRVIRSLEPIAAKNNISISLSGTHAIIKGVELIIDEMIYNLCDNAIKYNVPNGKIEVMIEQYVDGIELSVRDTGIGIPSKDIDHIFERFYRVDKSHSKSKGGTGLGLSIVKHGALLHGARISVKSKPKKGTTIRICF